MRSSTLFEKMRLRRVLLFLIADALLIALALYGSFLIRFDGTIPATWLDDFETYLAAALVGKLIIFYLFGLYRMSWAYVSFRELASVAQAVTLSSALLGTLYFLVAREPWGVTFPRGILVIDFILTLTLIGGFRSLKRIYLGLIQGFSSSKGRRVLIAGAGSAGEQIVRAMHLEQRSQYAPIGFVDDDPAKQGLVIHGVAVLGRCDQIPSVLSRHEIDELLIAIPSAPSTKIREIMECGRQAGLRHIKTLPGFHELITGQVSLANIREVQLEDLLGREPVQIDVSEIQGYLRGKRVLVTGAAGSIGSELCRQVAQFEPKRLIALDQDETGLFHLGNELQKSLSNIGLEILLCDLRDQNKIDQVFREFKPQVVFHAAAYKHVPLMEHHPEEAVKNNIFGTLNVAEAAQANGAEKFVLISTDKAVNPTSVMGATKRVAETVIQVLNGQKKTQYVAVRFGNVLGSRGSVIPEFQKQIQRGGPVTVTHPEMKRYFMVTAEAVTLVLQAGAMGRGGEVFVLDMGKPVKIVDLARDMIRLSGYEPDKEIAIVFTGIRPGEKLFEELLTAEEGTVATQHKQIFVAKLGAVLGERELRAKLETLGKTAEQGRPEQVKALIKEIVPTYCYSDN